MAIFRTHYAFEAPCQRGPRRHIVITLGTEKLEWWKKLSGEKIVEKTCLFVSIEYTFFDRQSPHDGRPHLRIVSYGNKNLETYATPKPGSVNRWWLHTMTADALGWAMTVQGYRLTMPQNGLGVETVTSESPWLSGLVLAKAFSAMTFTSRHQWQP